MEERNKIENYIENDRLNLEKIVDEYSGYVYKVVKNMVGKNITEEDEEEIIADTFFILWKNTEKLDLLFMIFIGISLIILAIPANPPTIISFLPWSLSIYRTQSLNLNPISLFSGFKRLPSSIRYLDFNNVNNLVSPR